MLAFQEVPLPTERVANADIPGLPNAGNKMLIFKNTLVTSFISHGMFGR